MSDRDIPSEAVSRRMMLSSVSGVALSAIVAPSVGARDRTPVEADEVLSSFNGDTVPSVSLTPQPAETERRQSLNGEWEFTERAGTDIPETDDWGSEDVPGQWRWDEILEDESEWYPPDDASGWYRRTFTIPSSWDGDRLKLRFGAVYSQATVWINETKVGEHTGGYTPFEIDITDEVSTDSDNTVTVAVSHDSAADEISWQNVTGGITRDVTLYSVPSAFVSQFHVDTELRDDGTATVYAETTVSNDGDEAVENAVVDIELTNPDGERAGSTERELEPLESGESRTAVLEIPVSDPVTWNPEQPRLYDIECTLAASDQQTNLEKRVGIRQLTVVGNELRLNGTALTLRGINWEEIHIPEHGHAVPEELTRRDAERLLEANINFVRTAHHPTSEAFLEACDELGIVVEVEAPHMFVGRGRPDPEYDLVLQQTAEMVERDRSRTSVCLWSIANESEWYQAFEDAATLIRELDPTRPTIFHYDIYDEGQPWEEHVDIDSHHYPAKRVDSTVDQFEDHNDPIMFGEYAHLYCYNDQELVTDPGLRDEWGRLFDEIWEQCRSLKACMGAAIWAGGDHLEQWGDYLWGIVDRHRRPRPEYWHVKKTYSPVKLATTEWVDDESVQLTIENCYEFVNLSDRRLEWEHAEGEGIVDADIEPGERGEIVIPAENADEVTVRACHPDGFTITSFALHREEPESERTNETGGGPPDGAGSVFEANGAVCAETPTHALSVDCRSGELAVGSGGNDSVVSGALELAATPIQSDAGRAYDEAIDHRLEERTVDDVRIGDDGETIVTEVSYETATGEFVIHTLSGGIEIEYDFTLEESLSLREVGLSLPVTDDHTTLSWTRDGHWSTYPADHIGRLSGTASAFPTGDRPDDDTKRLDPDQPWKDDATIRGSNDFRSTKRNVLAADLRSNDEDGVTILSEGDQHVRCQVRDDAVDVLVLDRSLSGSSADWMDRYPVLDQEPELESGTQLAGSVRFQVTGSRAGDPPAMD
ncbi:glycoside hydrolase family 2 protein [Halostagnicola bangensis]